MGNEITIWNWLFGQQGAIIFSAIAASTFAWRQIKNANLKHQLERDENRRRDRIKATLDYITSREWDEDFIKTRQEFSKLRNAEEGLEKFGKKGMGGFDEQDVIRRALNDYEIVAIGIKQGILDEGFYRLWCKSAVLTDYKASQGYINALNKAETEKTSRKTNYFCEFCELGSKWEQEN